MVTYAGYADESTVSLTNEKVVVVSRRQQLKTYLRTARKEVRRDLKQVRK